MTDTPITDDWVLVDDRSQSGKEVVLADTMRDLERELAAAQTQLAALNSQIKASHADLIAQVFASGVADKRIDQLERTLVDVQNYGQKRIAELERQLEDAQRWRTVYSPMERT